MKTKTEGFPTEARANSHEGRAKGWLRKPEQRSPTHREGDGKTFHQQACSSATFRDCWVPSIPPSQMEAFRMVILPHSPTECWVWNQRLLDNWHLYSKLLNNEMRPLSLFLQEGAVQWVYFMHKRKASLCMWKWTGVNCNIFHYYSSSPSPTFSFYIHLLCKQWIYNT